MYQKIKHYQSCSKHPKDKKVYHTELLKKSVPGGVKINTKARGRAVLHILNSQEFFIQIDVYDITNVTMAHIHFYNEKNRSENGPIVLWLFKNMEHPLKEVNGALIAKTFHLKDLLQKMDMTTFVSNIVGQKFYYNVHTVQNPNGELAGGLCN